MSKKIKKVLLIYPFAVSEAYSLDRVLKFGAFVEAPIGLGYLASFLKKHEPEIECEIFDANAMAIKQILDTHEVDMAALWNVLAAKVRDYHPDIIGISCLFHSIALTAHKTCAVAKQAQPNAFIAMGGNYPSGSPDEVLSDKNVDYVIFSEGEKSFLSLVQALNAGDRNLGRCDGIQYRRQESSASRYEGGAVTLSASTVPTTTYVYVQKNNLTEDLDEYPWPDRRNFDMDFYATNARHFAHRTMSKDQVRIATLTATRGCPFKCTFCSSKDFWGQQIRYRSPANVVGEMKHLIDKYDINTFVFNDDNIMFNRRFVLELCNQIARADLAVNWYSGGGIQVSSMKPDVVSALVSTGHRQFGMSIETKNKKTLKRIKKPLSEGVAEEVIATIRSHPGTWVGSNFITGFHFETLDDIEETLSYAASLDLDWAAIFEFTALPGTEDYDECIKRGYINPWTLSKAASGLEPLSTEHFSYREVQNLNYQANLEINFVRNRNLLTNPRQAIRDFGYVTDMVPDHAIGHYVTGIAYSNLEEWLPAYRHLKLACEAIENSKSLKGHSWESNIALVNAKINWATVFEKFGLDADNKLEDVWRQMASSSSTSKTARLI